MVDEHGTIVRANSAMESMFAYERGELCGKRIDDLVPERFRHQHAGHCSDFFAKPRTRAMGIGLTLRALRRDGGEFPVEISLSPVRTADGLFVVGAVRDISHSEERYRAVFEQMAVGIVHSTTDGSILNVNPKFCAITGYAREEALRMRIPALTHADDIADIMAHRAQLLNDAGTDYERDVRLIGREGREISCRITTSLVRGADGRPLHFVSIINDVSHERGEEARRRELELRFRQVTENIRDVFWLTNPANDETLYVSPAYESIWGQPIAELNRHPKSWMESIHPDDRERVVEAVRTRQMSGDYDERFRIVREDGGIRWIRDRAFPVRDERNRIVRIAGIAEDITESERAAEELRGMIAKLKRAVHSTIEVISTMGELRDPYTHGHEHRVGEIATAIATEMGLHADSIEAVRIAGHLHDVGKIAVPVEILSRPTRLSPNEFAIVKEHAQKGYEILKGIDFPWPVAEAVWQHHERLDGSGYPRALERDAIIVEARILAVADTVEAIASHRPYRASLGLDAALEEIERNRGRLFDSTVVDACLRLFRVKGYVLPA